MDLIKIYVFPQEAINSIAYMIDGMKKLLYDIMLFLDNILIKRYIKNKDIKLNRILKICCILYHRL